MLELLSGFKSVGICYSYSVDFRDIWEPVNYSMFLLKQCLKLHCSQCSDWLMM